MSHDIPDKHSALDDYSLILQLRNDNAQALGIIIDRYIEDATRFAFHIVKSIDSADDIVQSVFIWLWNNRRSLTDNIQLKPYLFRAVKNQSLNYLKAESVRTKYRNDTIADASLSLQSSTTPSHENSVLNTELVYSALSRLPLRRQLALRLRIINQMTHVEIAQVLEISQDAATKLVNRSLDELKKLLSVSDFI